VPKKARNLTSASDGKPGRLLLDAVCEVEKEFGLRSGALQVCDPVLSIPLPLAGYNPRSVQAMDCCGPQQSRSVADIAKVSSVTSAVAALFDEVNAMCVAIEDIEGRLGGVLRANTEKNNTAKACPVGATKHAQELLELSERLSAMRIRLIDITTRIDL
jgi:hypothetical protein